MGTRNLISVFKDGNFKVAQYCQWDGYPSGQGADILKFLKSADMSKFRAQVDKVDWVTQEQMKEAVRKIGIDPEARFITMAQSDKLKEAHPEWSRDTGAGILSLVLERDDLKLKNAVDFAADGLFCEWAYVVDLDNNKLSVYSGFNKGDGHGHFSHLAPSEDKYAVVGLVKEYPLDSLPEKDQFVQELEPSEDDV